MIYSLFMQIGNHYSYVSAQMLIPNLTPHTTGYLRLLNGGSYITKYASRFTCFPKSVSAADVCYSCNFHFKFYGEDLMVSQVVTHS